MARKPDAPDGNRNRLEDKQTERDQPKDKQEFRRANQGELPVLICHRLLIEKATHLAATARVLQLAERLCFNLANTFAGHAELLADFFERVVGVHADAKAHAQHAFFARGE
jgi:hypothetical protein